MNRYLRLKFKKLLWMGISAMAGLCSVSTLDAQISSKGKEFWFTLLDLAPAFGSAPDSFVVFMVSETNTTATIDVAGPPPGGLVGNFALVAGAIRSVRLDVNTLRNTTSESALWNKSVRIRCKDPISVYVLNVARARTDGTFVLPVEAIPKAPEFVIGAYFANVRTNGFSTPARYGQSEFSIVACDNVTVEITPTARTMGGRAAGTAFTVNLTKGQVYQVQSDDRDAYTSGSIPSGLPSGDLTGTIVKVINSCGKINVFAGTRTAYVPFNSCSGGMLSSDHLYAQQFPTTILGKEYTLMPFKTHTKGYVFRVIAVQNSTTVYVDGNSVATLNKGQVYNSDITTEIPVCIKTSNPAYVVQLMKTDDCAGTNVDGDPALVSIPANEQMVTNATIATPYTNIVNQFYINILVRSTATNSVFVNGSRLNRNDFLSISCGNYSYIQLKVNQGSHNIKSDSGFLAVTYGIGDNESYAYSAGALFENLNYDFTYKRLNKCPLTDVTFEGKSSGPVIKYFWNFGDGKTDTGVKVVHQYAKSGSYTVVMKAAVSAGCGKNDTITRSKTIVVFNGPNPAFADTMTQCSTAIKLTLDAGASVKFLYKWQDSSSKQTYNVTSQGKYWVRVIDTSTNCVAFDSTYVRLANPIKALYAIDSVDLCYKTNYFAYRDSTQFTGDWWKKSTWIFKVPNDTFFESSKILRSFDTIGTYPFKYAVESFKGCKDTASGFMIVHALPSARIELLKSIYCEKESLKIIDSSRSYDGAIFRSRWSWGDGNSSVALKPNYSYSYYDTFAVQLITETQFGCRDTADTTLLVHPLPRPLIDAPKNAFCFKLQNFTFRNKSSIPYGSSSAFWRYGNVVSPGDSITKIKFTDTGLFRVRLTLISNAGCIDSLDYSVRVHPHPKTRISMTDSSICQKGNFFKASDASTIGRGAIDSRIWTFSDGSAASTSNAITKSFTNFGNHWIRLITKSDQGCEDTLTRNVRVKYSPKANILIADSVLCFKNHQFKFDGTVNPNPPTGITIAYAWTFGDGGTDDIAKPNYSYATTGTYPVRLIVNSSESCADTGYKTVRVAASANSAFAASPSNACFTGHSFSFTNNTANPAGNTFLWQFGDGNQSTNFNVTGKTYIIPGKYTVRLIGTTAAGCKDTASTQIEVYPEAIANFGVNDSIQCLTGNSFVVSNSTTNPYAATGVRYTWDFTGGNVSNAQNPGGVNFTSLGTYLIRLRVETDKGCFTEKIMNFRVVDHPVVTASAYNICQERPIQFTGNATVGYGTIVSYQWDFGNGGQSLQQNPIYTYNNAGNYNVVLKATSSEGCEGSSSPVGIQVYPKAYAAFMATNLGTRGTEIDYKFGYTGSGATSWIWQFGDGQTAGDKDPNITFEDTGRMPIRLITNNSFYCGDTSDGEIYLKPELIFWLPSAFSPNADGLNETFKPSNPFGLTNYEMLIYNRWGEVLFSSRDPQKGWDGNYEGKPVDGGVYVYYIHFRYLNAKLYSFKGTLHVVR